MKANRSKLELALARACMSSKECAEAAKLPRPTFNNVLTGMSVRPATLGKVAKALGVDVEMLIDEEGT